LFVGLLAKRGHFFAHAFAIAAAEELPHFRALGVLDFGDLFLLVIGKVRRGLFWAGNKKGGPGAAFWGNKWWVIIFSCGG
jgi:hypothetical protein